MAIFSVSTQHAMIMLAHLAQQEKATTVRDVSKATGISKPTVAKVLHLLVKGGILASRKGPGGGFHVLTPPDRITLGKILRAVEGKELFTECVAGFESCNEENFCPLHEKWEPVKLGLVDFLESTTLQEMASAVLKGNK